MTHKHRAACPMWSWRIAAVTLALLCSTARSADAYTDPGSGALLWQVGLAAIFGAMFYVRRAVMWVRALFSGRGPDDPQT